MRVTEEPHAGRNTYLHIGDTAGVASVLSKYLKLLYSLNSEVINYHHLDPMRITRFYGGKLYGRSYPTNFRLLLKSSRYEIVHVHVHSNFIRRLRLLYPHKKLIVHFHGEETRLLGWEGERRVLEAADAAFYVTHDLSIGAPEKAVLLPNPVDTQHFSPKPEGRKQRTALYFVKHQRGENTSWADAMAKKFGVGLEVRDRRRNFIPYAEFPATLNRYEYYFDRNYPESLSATALQALACGLKVVDWRGELVDRFPEEHSPMVVITKFVESLRARGFFDNVTPSD